MGYHEIIVDYKNLLIYLYDNSELLKYFLVTLDPFITSDQQ